MGQAIPMQRHGYGEYMNFETPASKEVLFDILENHARLATVPHLQPEWFNEFYSNIDAVFNGEMTAQQYCESIKDTIQQLLDDSNAKAEYSKSSN